MPLGFRFHFSDQAFLDDRGDKFSGLIEYHTAHEAAPMGGPGAFTGKEMPFAHINLFVKPYGMIKRDTVDIRVHQT